jgi:autotransporter-associated beta strand protein
MGHLRNHFGTPLPGAVVNATWTRNASSDWGTTRTNWTGALPNFIGATVNFGGAATLPRTVTVTAPVTAGTLNFDNATNAYTIAGSSAITMDVTAGSARINVTGGSHAIIAPLALADDTVVTVTPAGSTLTVTNLQASSAKLTKAGAGTLVLTGANAHAGGTVVEGGTLVVANGAAMGTGGLTVNTGASARVSAGLPEALSVASVTTAGTGSVNLADNDMVVKSSTLAAVQAQITSGFSGGAWNGAGINSTSAATEPQGKAALGFASNAELGAADFSGVTGLDGDDILVKYTYYGDADLSGIVDLDDFSQFLDGYQNQSTIQATWLHGDFDYSGLVDLDDFSQFLFGYQNQSAPLTALSEAVADASGVSSSDRAFMQAAISAVPEPAVGAAIVASSCGLGLRRRARSRA